MTGLDGCTCYPIWHRMLYSCNHMATVGVKGLVDLGAATYMGVEGRTVDNPEI